MTDPEMINNRAERERHSERIAETVRLFDAGHIRSNDSLKKLLAESRRIHAAQIRRLYDTMDPDAQARARQTLAFLER